MFHILNFQPIPGFSSPHLQMILANFVPTGQEPPSTPMVVTLPDGDRLSCEVSTPVGWRKDSPTVVMVHGVGGSHLSPYMVRLSRKFFQNNRRVVRINLRGAGSGVGLCQRPYNCGSSQDVWQVLKHLNTVSPHSPVHLIGFSLGGSLIIKMASEQGESAGSIVTRMTAVCPVLDLTHTVYKISLKGNSLYQRYYLKKILEQGQQWIKKPISSLKDFDDHVTAPLWGYQDANDYYKKCSAVQFLPDVKIPCNLLLAADDPFIDHRQVTHVSSSTKAWLTHRGSHMGFIGFDESRKGPFWMDRLLLSWN